jgi:hypothetical protein
MRRFFRQMTEGDAVPNGIVGDAGDAERGLGRFVEGQGTLLYMPTMLPGISVTKSAVANATLVFPMASGGQRAAV